MKRFEGTAATEFGGRGGASAARRQRPPPGVEPSRPRASGARPRPQESAISLFPSILGLRSRRTSAFLFGSRHSLERVDTPQRSKGSPACGETATLARRIPSQEQIQTKTREGGDGRIGRATRFPVVSLCAQCGQPTFDSGGLCPYHNSGHGDDWAAGNRIMCDFLHRGIVSPGPPDLVDRSLEFPVDRLEAALTE